MLLQIADYLLRRWRMRPDAPLTTRASIAQAFVFAICLLSAGKLFAVDVLTLGGGRLVWAGPDYGYVNGNTQTNAQFNTPTSISVDSSNNLYMADHNNNDVRLITKVGDLANSQSSTYIQFATNTLPVGVLVDSGNNLYVLTHGNNDMKVRKYNRFKNLLWTSSTLPSTPSAMTLAQDAGTNLFIAITNGSDSSIIKLTQTNTSSTIATLSGLRIAGMALTGSGQLAVSDLITHGVYLVNPNTGFSVLLTGGHGPGFDEGDPAFVMFNQPAGLAASGDGRLIVADTLNHRVRSVDLASGYVSTLYGIASTNWAATDFPGWVDGDSSVAEARKPVGVTISGDTLYTTEIFYHILRKITGAGLSVALNTNVPAPTFSPMCGYYPDCVTIYVTNYSGTVYYTTDGTTPTTNSLSVITTPNGNYSYGSVRICDSLHDLRFLTLRCISGTNASAIVTGQSCDQTEIGFTHDYTNGTGSTAIIPIVLNLQGTNTVQTLQYRAEVTPTDPGTPPIYNFRALSFDTNDFVQLLGSGQLVIIRVEPYYLTNSRTSGLLISSLATNINFKNAVAAAMLAVTLPTSAVGGQTYRLDILYPSATSDGHQAAVAITNMASRLIHVGFNEYLVGDSSFGAWYNAGDFGDGDLSNNDVNNAVYASAGMFVPYNFSDVFNAMDVFPPDTSGVAGGDGIIRYLDWETLLRRSVRLDTNNWARAWSSGGTLTNRPINSIPTHQAAAPTKNESKILPPGTVWFRHATIGAGSLANLIPGGVYSIPVYVKVMPGYSVAGLQFRATLEPQGNAPIPGQIQFITPAGSAAPGYNLAGRTPNDMVCAWALDSFGSALQNSNLLGYVQFQVPVSAQAGQSYVLRISKSDGSPDYLTQYDFQSVPGAAWVQSPALQPQEVISDEWKTQFFGSYNNPTAAANVDADGDGVSNLQEFLAGTNPTNSLSCLRFVNPGLSTSAPRGVALRWLTAPGKIYTVERSQTVTGNNWAAIAGNIAGDGYVKEMIDTNTTASAFFYRIRVQAP